MSVSFFFQNIDHVLGRFSCGITVEDTSSAVRRVYKFSLLWTHKTQDENKQIKNGQSRDTGNIEHTKHRMKTNKSRMGNPEILATLSTQNTG